MNKEAMVRLVRAGRKANELDESLMDLGYTSTPYSDIYGDIADAIYFMLGEKTETLDQSITYQAITDDSLTDGQCAEKLLSAYTSSLSSSAFSCSIPEHTITFLQQAAERRGITREALISIILSEWTLRHEWLNNFIAK